MRLAMQLGRQLEAVDLCTITVRGDRVEKRRTPAADFLIPPGNVLLRWHPVPVRVPRPEDWARRESRLYLRLYSQAVERLDDGLSLPRLPGRTVLDQLDNPAAFPAAVAALHDLHSHSLRGHPVSHGDATAHNVLFDGTTARWLDFDAEHHRHAPARLRHADDLRALLFSAVGRAPHRVDALLRAVMTYPVPTVREALVELCTSRRLRLSPYHHGQALMPADVHDGLIARLREAQSSSGTSRIG